MEKQKTRTVYVCRNCGKETSKWEGRCPACQEWNCMEETVVAVSRNKVNLPSENIATPQELSRVQKDAYARISISYRRA